MVTFSFNPPRQNLKDLRFKGEPGVWLLTVDISHACVRVKGVGGMIKWVLIM